MNYIDKEKINNQKC